MKQMNIGEQRVKTISEMSKIFTLANEPISYEKLIEESKDLSNGFMITDNAVVMGIQPLTEFAKQLICSFIEADEHRLNKIIPYEPKKLGGSKFSFEYLDKAMKILKINSDYIKISSSEDYLGIFENENFKIFIAPRVEQ
jgi:hypothetical protein